MLDGPCVGCGSESWDRKQGLITEEYRTGQERVQAWAEMAKRVDRCMQTYADVSRRGSVERGEVP